MNKLNNGIKKAFPRHYERKGFFVFRREPLFAAAAEKVAHAAAVLIAAEAHKKQGYRQTVATVEYPVKTAVFSEKDYQ